MSLRNQLRLPSEGVNTHDYYVLMESHLPLVRQMPTTRVVQIEGHEAAKYRGDFHGLLNSLGLDKKFHYLTTRLNGMYRSQDYDGQNVTLYLPDESRMNGFIATFESVQT